MDIDYSVVKEEELYDFLFEHDYPGWFCSSVKQNLDKRSLELWIMNLHTGDTFIDLHKQLDTEQQWQLGQEYLHNLAEDILVQYDGWTNEQYELGFKPPVEWEDLPDSFQNLYRRLELDGYEFRNSRLLFSETDVLEKDTPGILEDLYYSLGLENEKTAVHHLKLSEQHYMEQKWDDSISQSRKFLECVLQEVAAARSLQNGNIRLSKSIYESPLDVRDYLKREGLFDAKETKALASVYGLLSDKGNHPNIAENDQARLLRNLALTFSQFVMLRFQAAPSAS